MSYANENKGVEIVRMLRPFVYAIIDTSSLMEDSFPIWMDRLALAHDYLKETGTKIYIPKECISELRRHKRNRAEFEKKLAALRALKIVAKAKHKKEIEILKGLKKSEYAFADNAIFVRVSKDRLNKQILVICQDKKLATDVAALNDLLSQRGRPVSVYRLNKQGDLVPNKGEDFIRDQHANKEAHKPNFNNKPSFESSKGAQQKQLQKPTFDNKPAAKPQQKPTVQQNQNPVKTEQKPFKTPISFPKPKPNKPAAPTKEKDDLWFGTGKNVRLALQDCAVHYGILFRYPTIPYMEQFHGPVNVTEQDLDAIITGLEQQLDGYKKVTYIHNGLVTMAEATPNGFRAWIDVRKPEPKKPETPKAQESKPMPKSDSKPAAKPIEKNSKQTEQPSKPEEKASPKVESAPKDKPASKRKPAKKPAEATKKEAKPEPKPNLAEVPAPTEEGTLVVLTPSTKKEREAIESKVRNQTQSTPKAAKKPAAKATKEKKEEKPAEPKKEEAPKKATDKKKEQKTTKPTKVKKEPAPTEQKKDAAKSASKKAESSKPAEASAKKKPAEAKPESKLDAALQNERVLLADFANPKATKKRKEDDLKLQIKLCEALPAKDKAKLRKTMDELKSMLSELK